MSKENSKSGGETNENSPSKFRIDWGISVSVFIPAIITVFSWFEASKLESDRDRDNKLRDIKTTYLIDAYRKLANATQRTENIVPYHRDVEAAITDIQLFGSPEQINEIILMIDSASAQNKRLCLVLK